MTRSERAVGVGRREAVVWGSRQSVSCWFIVHFPCSTEVGRNTAKLYFLDRNQRGGDSLYETSRDVKRTNERLRKVRNGSGIDELGDSLNR